MVSLVLVVRLLIKIICFFIIYFILIFFGINVNIDGSYYKFKLVKNVDEEDFIFKYYFWVYIF